ncbi:MAG TPA: MFS transporter [Acetobacteraceae bacterium]|jgi:EmrB/QacA subfamily drug resistance transporter|nr:MFS transporter [Acetobacteraceae bacterium]
MPRKPASTRTTALIVAAAMFMEMLDGTVLSTALPAMARSFHADPLNMSVALTSYLLSLAVFIPASGKVADRLGSRTVFAAAIALFTLGSVLCGLSTGLPFLVAARIIQGIGGAMMVPVGRLVLLRTIPKAELVSAMAWLLVPATIGPVVGPPVGGFIVTYLNWRWIFGMNVPIGLAGIVLVLRYIDEIREPEKRPFDVPGLGLTAVSLSCLTFGLEMGSRGAASLRVTAALLAIGVVTGVLYIRHARLHPDPILDLRLMRIPTFRISVYAGACSRVAAGAMPFLLPLMLQLGFGMSAVASGMITFVSAVGSLLMRVTAQPMLRALGYRRTMIWVGMLATFLFGMTAAFRPDWPRSAIYGLLLLGGYFQSLQFMAYNTIAYADIPRERMSAATSFYTTFQQLFLSLGIATSAAALGAAVAIRGNAGPTLPDFSVGFLVVTVVALGAPLVSLWLAPDAGAELSGRLPQQVQLLRTRRRGTLRKPIIRSGTHLLWAARQVWRRRQA